MTWALIDDEMAFNEKVLAAGNGAFGAWVRMLCWVRRKQTNGKVPAAIAAQIASKKELASLVNARLLDRTEDGLEIHDYADHNLSAEALKERRAARAGDRSEHARRAASARWSKPKPSPQRDAQSESSMMPNRNRALLNDAPECPASPPLPLPSASSMRGALAHAPDEGRVLEELRRHAKSRVFAGVEWAGEILMLAAGAREEDLFGAIRKAVAACPEGANEELVRKRVAAYVSRAKTIEAANRRKDQEAAAAETPEAPSSHLRVLEGVVPAPRAFGSES